MIFSIIKRKRENDFAENLNIVEINDKKATLHVGSLIRNTAIKMYSCSYY